MKRNIGQELLDGIEAIKTGGGVRHAVELPDDAKAIREKTGLSHSALPLSWASVFARSRSSNKSILNVTKNSEIMRSVVNILILSGQVRPD